MSDIATYQLGWQTTHNAFSIKQGASAQLQIRLRVVDDNNAPLPSYDNFTAEFKLQTSNGKVVQTFSQASNTLTVLAQPLTQEVAITLIFKSDDTIQYPSGQTLLGSLKVTLPNGIEHQYPYDITLLVLRTL